MKHLKYEFNFLDFTLNTICLFNYDNRQPLMLFLFILKEENK